MLSAPTLNAQWAPTQRPIPIPIQIQIWTWTWTGGHACLTVTIATADTANINAGDGEEVPAFAAWTNIITDTDYSRNDRRFHCLSYIWYSFFGIFIYRQLIGSSINIYYIRIPNLKQKYGFVIGYTT